MAVINSQDKSRIKLVAALVLTAQSTCPINSGDAGPWLDSNGNLLYRDATGNDVRIASTSAAPEQISASGALSTTIKTTILSVTGTKAYTLANGTFIGQRKTIFCRAVASTPVGVVTPATPHNFATLTFGTANTSAEVEWNGTGWDLVGIAGSVTVA